LAIQINLTNPHFLYQPLIINNTTASYTTLSSHSNYNPYYTTMTFPRLPFKS